ncbi:MAG: winged helix-turn-helix domain-containing protein [Candidatus Aminicenantes bacterium]|nr:winged helix-turn-helix domain-containing protein [Candidatus Aminicenantes bacterium]MDH5467191.1 winged helix-turn-helix domain-containing protein [Candidatus Aminicenantes bacterium]MDH5705932.1 winged helix-turn-helix domain-containing protein [Candidatus Aminicenantes bacterium]
MREKVGATAGQIWDLLKKKGEVNMAELPRLLKEKSTVVYQAIGWLARENKIEYRTAATKTFVSLAESEKIL